MIRNGDKESVSKPSSPRRISHLGDNITSQLPRSCYFWVAEPDNQTLAPLVSAALIIRHEHGFPEGAGSASGLMPSPCSGHSLVAVQPLGLRAQDIQDLQSVMDLGIHPPVGMTPNNPGLLRCLCGHLVGPSKSCTSTERGAPHLRALTLWPALRTYTCTISVKPTMLVKPKCT